MIKPHCIDKRRYERDYFIYLLHQRLYNWYSGNSIRYNGYPHLISGIINQWNSPEHVNNNEHAYENETGSGERFSNPSPQVYPQGLIFSMGWAGGRYRISLKFQVGIPEDHIGRRTNQVTNGIRMSDAREARTMHRLHKYNAWLKGYR